MADKDPAQVMYPEMYEKKKESASLSYQGPEWTRLNLGPMIASRVREQLEWRLSHILGFQCD